MMNKKTKRNPNFHYPVRTIRISDKVWDKLKEKRQKSKKSWNLFICELIEKYGDETLRKVF